MWSFQCWLCSFLYSLALAGRREAKGSGTVRTVVPFARDIPIPHLGKAWEQRGKVYVYCICHRQKWPSVRRDHRSHREWQPQVFQGDKHSHPPAKECLDCRVISPDTSGRNRGFTGGRCVPPSLPPPGWSGATDHRWHCHHGQVSSLRTLCLALGPKDFLLSLFPGSFTVFCFTFMSVIYFELIFE